MQNIIDEILSKTISTEQITPEILLVKFPIVNAFMVKNPDNSWVLVDTGLKGYSRSIMELSQKHFGKDSLPKAIILTHGHFDHVGTVIDLAKEWDLTVYAHELELPYLTGMKDYPEGDTGADGGLIAKLSSFLPNEGINLRDRISPLPSNGTIPFMSEWKWIHTPGHTPGHISLYKENDKVLIVGDAFTTTKQESLISSLSRKEDFNGPPAYFTPDWNDAQASVKKLEALNPSLVVPSHGTPLGGVELKKHLRELVRNFSEREIPDSSKFV